MPLALINQERQVANASGGPQKRRIAHSLSLQSMYLWSRGEEHRLEFHLLTGYKQMIGRSVESGWNQDQGIDAYITANFPVR